MSYASENRKLEAVIRAQGGYRVASGGWEFAKHSSPKYNEGVADGKKSGHKAGVSEERKRVAELLMDVFDVRDRYPDVTRTINGLRTSHEPYLGYTSYPVTEPYTYEVTDYGYEKFLADVEAIQAHVNAKGARKRLFGKK